MSRRVLIAESGKSGHLLVYVREVAAAAIGRGDDVTIALSQTSRSSLEFKLNLERLDVTFVDLPKGNLLNALTSLAAEHNADAVIVPHADPLIPHVALRGYRGDGRLRLLLMRDPHLEHAGTLPRLVRKLAKILACRVVNFRSRVDLVWLRPFGYKGRELHVTDPFVADGTLDDFRKEGNAIRSKLSLSADRFWFVVTGAITPRKNVPLILDALSLLVVQKPGVRVGLALIGPLRGGSELGVTRLKESAESGGFSLVIDDRLLSNREMNSVVTMADSVVMAYTTPNPNSTLVKARALGSRLVVAGPYPVRAFAHSLGYQRTCVLNVSALATQMALVIDDSSPQPDFTIASSENFATGLLGAESDR